MTGIQINPDDYLAYIADIDADDVAKRSLIEAVVVIMGSFVDRAFGLAPEQILLGTRQRTLSYSPQPAIDSKRSIGSTFKQAASNAEQQ